MIKKFISLVFFTATLGTHSQEELQDYQIFLASLSHKSVTSQVRILSNESFSEKKLIKFLGVSSASIVIPKVEEKSRKWIDYKLKFSDSLTLDQAPTFYESLIEKIEKLELEGTPKEFEKERALARAIVERDLLEHILKSTEYQSREESRQKLKDFGAR